MKILMTTDTIGGVWNYSVQLCRALDRHGVEVALATMGGPLSPAQRSQAASLRNISLHESSYRLEWMDDPWNDVDAAGAWLLRLERTERPDVVHLNGYVHAALPWSVPVLAVGHSCVLSWWQAVHGTAAPADWQQYRERVAAGLRAADVVVTPTAAMRDALNRHYGPLPHTAVIMNGRDADALPLGVRDAFGRYRGRADTPEPVVLAAGRVWDESKNMAVLAEAAPRLPWPVFVAGADRDPNGTRHQLAGVHQLGMLPPHVLRRWYRRASILVHPARYEPFGLVPLEAALQHCALVLGDIPSLREVWGAAATYIDPTNADALTTACNELSASPHLLADRAAAAARRARELTGAHMARTYLETYRRLKSRTAMRPHVLDGEVPACV